MKLLISSRNIDKISEIKNLVGNLELEIITALDIPDLIEIEEDKDTIQGNAEKKALEMTNQTGLLTIADDTGLFVDALNGEPGVFSARYAGDNCSYADNRIRLISEMKKKHNRKASFKTAVSLALPHRLIATVIGEVHGSIIDKELGDNGFGYDSIFLLEETGHTFAQMSDEEKNKVSHRARAFEKILPIIENFLKLQKEEA
ncbi:MAG: RdgB/HAM1 family non-canonical purine NTP pyrophosphatase [Candidatus Cloacimonetes bacterium]|nr:RdgB/HAM1 family non-canonical purine NTP pyrophosphatase [Candidatus Cloacimonadota bacterium]